MPAFRLTPNSAAQSQAIASRNSLQQGRDALAVPARALRARLAIEYARRGLTQLLCLGDEGDAVGVVEHLEHPDQPAVLEVLVGGGRPDRRRRFGQAVAEHDIRA